MEVLKKIPSEIKDALIQYEQNGSISIHPSVVGSRSIIFRLSDFCLKTYTLKGRRDGESECNALIELQERSYVPELYAYSPGKFILTEWIEGYNLSQYQRAFGRVPENFIYDMFSTELQLVNAGYKDWDFKISEHLIWTDSGIVKRIDFGHCEPADLHQDYFKRELQLLIEKVYNTDDPEFIDDLLIAGVDISQIEHVLASFRGREPRIGY